MANKEQTQSYPNPARAYTEMYGVISNKQVSIRADDGSGTVYKVPLADFIYSEGEEINELVEFEKIEIIEGYQLKGGDLYTTRLTRLLDKDLLDKSMALDRLEQVAYIAATGHLIIDNANYTDDPWSNPVNQARRFVLEEMEKIAEKIKYGSQEIGESRLIQAYNQAVALQASADGQEYPDLIAYVLETPEILEQVERLNLHAINLEKCWLSIREDITIAKAYLHTLRTEEV
jgi:hypothetical protein